MPKVARSTSNTAVITNSMGTGHANRCGARLRPMPSLVNQILARIIMSPLRCHISVTLALVCGQSRGRHGHRKCITACARRRISPAPGALLTRWRPPGKSIQATGIAPRPPSGPNSWASQLAPTPNYHLPEEKPLERPFLSCYCSWRAPCPVSA
jgi:hypothetical protein